MTNFIYQGDPAKGPNEVLDYKTDFKNTTNGGSIPDYLLTGETISTVSVIATTGINLHDGVTTFNGVIKAAPIAADTATTVVFWLSGGVVGKTYTITVTITTSDGRTIERARLILVKPR